LFRYTVVGAFYAKSELNKQGTPFGFFTQHIDSRGFTIVHFMSLDCAVLSPATTDATMFIPRLSLK
jgi:hypothetical protein